ncbi:MAG: amidohydrolase, partial [Lysobacterales bacterium]
MNGLKTLLIGLLAIFSLAAQATDTIMIRGATVHTMTGDGILENTDIFISDGKVQNIGKDLPVPQDDVNVFNADGKTLTPG